MSLSKSTLILPTVRTQQLQTGVCLRCKTGGTLGLNVLKSLVTGAPHQRLDFFYPHAGVGVQGIVLDAH
eukprot:4934915-Pyramimonas_sp.AAC.1